MKNYTRIKRSLLCAALLLNISAALSGSAQTTPAPAKPEQTKPAPRLTVYAAGAVNKAGPVQLEAGATLDDIFVQAKGWTKDADLTQVRITRHEKISGKEKTTTQIVNFDDYVNVKPSAEPDEANNPLIKDKDRIFVGFKVSKKAAPHAAPKR